jgi:sRNA-binding regulator protein Hfq
VIGDQVNRENVGGEEMTEGETIDKTEAKPKSQPKPRPCGPNFLNKLVGHKVLCRMVDGRPVNAVLEAYNAYELLFNIGNGKRMLIFKHAVSSIEFAVQAEKDDERR